MFLYNAVQELLQNEDNKVILLLDMPKHECDLFESEFRPQLPNFENLVIICLSEWLVDTNVIVKYSNIFLEKSYRFYQGVRKLADIERLDYIEFFDYVGIGYFTFKAKKYENEFSEVLLGVRAHCTIDLMDIEQVPNSFDFNKLEMYQMEKEAIQDADYVLVPSKAWGGIYQTRYGVEPNKIIVSPPPVKQWEDVQYASSLNQKDVLFYGRIFQLKGVDMLIDAAVSFMSMRPESKSLFYLVGYDGLSSNNLPYKEELLQRVPEQLRNRFVFPGHLNHEQLEKLLKSIRFAVFPNYVESFCYSIHEIYNIGVPIICNNIPAFSDYFIHGDNALVFNGTSSELVDQMANLFDDENLRQHISRPYSLINDKSFVDVYEKDLVLNKNENYKNVGNSKLVETQTSLCSLIVIANNNEQTENYKTLIVDPLINMAKSYILYPEAPGTPIHFLGELRYARKMDGSTDDILAISEFVLVCYVDDIIESEYVRRAINILSMSKELKYVGAYFKNTEHYHQYSLLESSTYWGRSIVTRAVYTMNGIKSTLRDVYDIRFRELGEKKVIGQPGYIIPSEYITIGDNLSFNGHVQNETYIFSVHHHSRFSEWNPSILYPFLFKDNTLQAELISGNNFNFMKKTYHRLKHKVDTMKGAKGKYLSLLLRILHRQLKKRF